MAMSARKFWLLCGILSSALYVGTDLVGAIRYEGYSYASGTISELSAIGSPVRSLVVPFFFAYGPLVIAFGWGVWTSAEKRATRVAAGSLIAYGLVCLAGPFTPMHRREVLAAGGGTLTDTLHVIGAAVDASLAMLAIGFGSVAFGRRFRRFSIGTLLVVLSFGAVSGSSGPRIAANLPTPWAGAIERICIFSFMLWVAVLAAALLRARTNERPPRAASAHGEAVEPAVPSAAADA